MLFIQFLLSVLHKLSNNYYFPSNINLTSWLYRNTSAKSLIPFCFPPAPSLLAKKCWIQAYKLFTLLAVLIKTSRVNKKKENGKKVFQPAFRCGQYLKAGQNTQNVQICIVQWLGSTLKSWPKFRFSQISQIESFLSIHHAKVSDMNTLVDS